MQEHLGHRRGGAEVAVDLERRMVVPEVVQGGAHEDRVQVLVGPGPVGEAGKHPDGPGPAPAGPGPAFRKTALDGLDHRVAHDRIVIQVDLVAGIGADHVGNMAMARGPLPKRQAPLHQPSVLANLGTVHLRLEFPDTLHERIPLFTDRLGSFQVIVEHLQYHELVIAVPSGNRRGNVLTFRVCPEERIFR